MKFSIPERLLSFCLTAVALAACSAGEDDNMVNDLIAFAVGDRVEVRWTTPVPTKCRVQHGSTAELGRETPEDPSCLRGSTNARRNPGRGYANNHRATLAGIRNWPVHLRVAGRTAEDKEFTGPTVTVNAPSPPKADGKPGQIELHIDRGEWKVPNPPVTVGVPMPKGALADAANVRILDGERELPCQAAVVSRYRDGGTAKWIRVSFQAPDGSDEVTLAYGRARSRLGTHLQMTRENGRITIRTGAAELRLDSTGRGELRQGDTVLKLPRGMLVGADGKKFVSRAEKISVEEAGPVMIVLRLNGHHFAEDGSKLFAFEERIYAYDGKPYVRLDYTFGNDNVGRNMTPIRSLDLVFDDAARDGVQVGVGAERCSLDCDGRVFQREDFEWVLEPGGRKGKRIAGAVKAGEGSILLRRFWEQWPKSVERAGTSLKIGLCPALPKDFYAGRPDEHKFYYHIRDGLHTFRQGLAKTHILYLDVSGAAGVESLPGDEPVASSPPQWIEDTGALRGLAVRTREQFAGYDEALAAMIDRYHDVTDARREYGMMNYGDWFGERRYNWGNLEYDLHHSLFTQFARTGDARFFRAAADSARHEGDIDTRHWADDPACVGQQWLHSVGHTAGYYPGTWHNMHVYAERGWSDNRGHVWNRGLLEHYLLGGDRRSWETALLISDWAAGPQTTNFDFGNAREPGWMLIVVMAAYNATEDPFYLNAARIMVRKVREKSKATGDHGFYAHQLGGGHCRCEKKHTGEAGFMLATLMTGLHMYYEVTGDKQAAEDVVKIVRYIIDKMWVPSERAFRYTSCPKTSAGPSRSWIQSEGFGFAARYSKDAEIARITRESLAAAWQCLSLTGKSGGFVLCFAPQGLHEIAQLPGPPFCEWRDKILRRVRSPARRPLPTIVPNPDFEEDIQGWPSRGLATSRCTEVKHSGLAGLRIEGKKDEMNEYVNTTYDTAASPFEIRSLKPGETYRLTAWLRVDRLDDGTPAPSMRLAVRDQYHTRGATATNTYDTSKLGTWQKLTADIKIPEWNTRNYIALNTNGRGMVGVVMYLDDVSLVPAAAARADTYEHHRLDPDTASVSGGMKVRDGEPGFGKCLAGAGEAAYAFSVEAGGSFFVWAKAGDGSGEAVRVEIDGKEAGTFKVPSEPRWMLLGEIELAPGEHRCVLHKAAAAGWVGRIVLTTDPSAG